LKARGLHNSVKLDQCSLEWDFHHPEGGDLTVMYIKSLLNYVYTTKVRKLGNSTYSTVKNAEFLLYK